MKRTKELQRLPVLGPSLRVLCLWVSYPFPPPNCWPSCVRTVRCEYLNLIPSACCDFAATVGYEESPGSAYESNEHRGLVKLEGWDDGTSCQPPETSNEDRDQPAHLSEKGTDRTRRTERLRLAVQRLS